MSVCYSFRVLGDLGQDQSMKLDRTSLTSRVTTAFTHAVPGRGKDGPEKVAVECAEPGACHCR